MWYPTPVLTSVLETSAWPDNLLRDESVGGEWGERLAASVCRFGRMVLMTVPGPL